jgi:hypothetical protein
MVFFGGRYVDWRNFIYIAATHCELSDNNPSDARVIQNTGDIVKRGGNQLLVMSADCKQLTDWRGRARNLLDDYVQYQIAVGAMTTNSSPASLKQSCDTLRRQGNKINSSAIVGPRRRLKTYQKQWNSKTASSLACWMKILTLAILDHDPDQN